MPLSIQPSGLTVECLTLWCMGTDCSLILRYSKHWDGLFESSAWAFKLSVSYFLLSVMISSPHSFSLLLHNFDAFLRQKHFELVLYFLFLLLTLTLWLTTLLQQELESWSGCNCFCLAVWQTVWLCVLSPGLVLTMWRRTWWRLRQSLTRYKPPWTVVILLTILLIIIW